MACLSVGLSSAIADCLANACGALAGGDGEREGQEKGSADHNCSRRLQSKPYASVPVSEKAAKQMRTCSCEQSDRELFRIVRKSAQRRRSARAWRCDCGCQRYAGGP